MFENLKVVNSRGNNKTSSIKCIKKITIKGFLKMVVLVKNEDMKFLLTKRVYQDCLEFFSEKCLAKS